jgi:hypothetical protein
MVVNEWYCNDDCLSRFLTRKADEMATLREKVKARGGKWFGVKGKD